MGWKEEQEKVLKKLDPEQKKWVEKNVELKVDNLRRLSTEEVRKWFPGKRKREEPVSTVDDARLIRSFIWQSWLMIRVKELKPVMGNLRSFWYRDLRPFYVNHKLLESDEGPSVLLVFRDIPHLEEEVLLSHLEEEELLGLLSGIETGQKRELYLTNNMGIGFDNFVLKGFFRFKGEFKFQDPREAFRIIGRKKPRIIFFTEKEGLFWLCVEFSKKYGISAIAFHGEPGYLTMEYFADELKKFEIKNLEIGAFTDYDPWGYNIAEEPGEKLQEKVFGFKVRTTHLTSLNLFTPESIERAKRDLRNVHPSKWKQVEEWMKKTGGIDGEPYGMHVDHAEFDRVREAVDKWYKDVTGKKKIGRRKKT